MDIQDKKKRPSVKDARAVRSHNGMLTPARTENNMNIIHIGNHPDYVPHIAFGAIKPYFADFHIYLQSNFPFFRFWKP